MSIGDNDMEKYLETTRNLQLYKELEALNLKEASNNLDRKDRKNTFNVVKLLKKKSKVTPLSNKKNQPHTQYELFQKSMKILLTCGQCIGLNPVIGITSKDVSKMKFTFISLRILYSCFIGLIQALFITFCIIRLARNSISISILAFISFYLATFMITCLFLRIATKWPSLMQKIANCALDKYVDVTIQAKCFYYTVIMLPFGLVEHLLSQNTKIIDSINCATENITIYEKYLELSFPWFKELNYTLPLPIGVVLQFINITSTISWSYSDLFIVCMSIYLVSILEKINESMSELDQKVYHPSFWTTIREDYTRATDLVASFDSVISGAILVSFANNLFFICLQMFHILSHGVQGKMGPSRSLPCASSASRGAYENLVYLMFSLAFVLGRFFAVSVVAARVHTASQVPARALYKVPSAAYCVEVQRFIEQVHGNTVALSGLQFFHVTKGLILSVASTIVTYELVLLQFNEEDN